MIIRCGLKCDTCGTVIAVRIGMGQGVEQDHTINCIECNEPISFGMKVNYTEISTDVFAIDGCSIVETPPFGASPVINVDANFVIPGDMVNKDIMFHRIIQTQRMMEAAEKFGPLAVRQFDIHAPRHPIADYLSEWKQVKKAVSLSCNGKEKLADKKVKSGSDEYYANDPLDGPTDWFFRFTLKFLGQKYNSFFHRITNEISSITNAHNCRTLIDHYATTMVKMRFQRYREIYTDFFSKYSQFSQVLFQAALGLPPSDDMVATSVQFDIVKSFYGDAFEVFAGSVDFLAMLNNVKSGREYDQFSTIDLGKYLKLDNASKFNPFSGNAVFIGLCEERDNQIRNASHHKGIQIDAGGLTLRYRSGKGGSGDEQEMTYSSYLYRSVCIFFQICVLAATELVFCEAHKIDLPFD